MPTTTRQAQVVAAWLAGPKGLTLSGDALTITDERGRDVTAQYAPDEVLRGAVRAFLGLRKEIAP